MHLERVGEVVPSNLREYAGEERLHVLFSRCLHKSPALELASKLTVHFSSEGGLPNPTSSNNGRHLVLWLSIVSQPAAELFDGAVHTNKADGSPATW